METRSGSIKDPMYYPNEREGSIGSGTGGTLDREGSDRGRSSTSSQEFGLDELVASKVPKKFITNWRQACDRTRDKTKDLLKRWRATPSNVEELVEVSPDIKQIDHPSWTVHVWTTWVSRYPSDESISAVEELSKAGRLRALAPIQREKFSHFFTYLLDHDKDGFIERKDFRMFSERLRRFADWSWNGPEYLRLLEIEDGFADLILQERKYDSDNCKKIDLEDWLSWWAEVVAPPGGASYKEVPFWVKIMPRVLFLAMNSSGSGVISKKELAAFYGSVVGLDNDRITKCLDIAYSSMTSNGDHPLGWSQYQLAFANFLFGRGPFGPGEHIFGLTDSAIIRGNNIPFPIDYSAMNTPRDKLEVYSPHYKSSRRSIVV